MSALGPCDLCGRSARLSIALLREPWSANRVSVVACTRCSAVAWRTLDAPLPRQRPTPVRLIAGPARVRGCWLKKEVGRIAAREVGAGVGGDTHKAIRPDRLSRGAHASAATRLIRNPEQEVFR